jgi:hypothetical protein
LFLSKHWQRWDHLQHGCVCGSHSTTCPKTHTDWSLFYTSLWRKDQKLNRSQHRTSRTRHATHGIVLEVLLPDLQSSSLQGVDAPCSSVEAQTEIQSALQLRNSTQLSRGFSYFQHWDVGDHGVVVYSFGFLTQLNDIQMWCKQTAVLVSINLSA